MILTQNEMDWSFQVSSVLNFPALHFAEDAIVQEADVVAWQLGELLQFNVQYVCE